MSVTEGYEKTLKHVEKIHSPIMAWTILFVSLILTVVAWVISSNYVEQREKDKFKFELNELSVAIIDRMSIYEQVLNGGAAFIDSVDNVDRAMWRNYVNKLELKKNWPGIQGLGYSIPLRPNELREHELQLRTSGFKDFKVKPEGKRDFYTSILYLEPFDWRNERALGYDMWSNEMRRKAMLKSVEDNSIAISGLITLVQETSTDTQLGFLVYKPVYKKGTLEKKTSGFTLEDVECWVYSPFRVKDLMSGILSSSNTDLEKSLHMEIYDEEVSPESLVYAVKDMVIQDQHSAKVSRFREVDLPLSGRTWKLCFYELDEKEGISFGLPEYVAMGGLFIDILLFYVILSLSSVQQKATELALPQIAKSEEKLRTLFDGIPISVFEVDYEGKIIIANHEVQEMFGYRSEDVSGKNIDILIPERFKSQHKKHFEIFCKTPMPLKLQNREFRAKRQDGSEFFVEIAIVPSVNNTLICSINDINDRIMNQKKLLEKNSEISRLFSFGLIGYVKSNIKGQVLEVDDYFLNLIGYSRSDFEKNGMNWQGITPRDSFEDEQQIFNRLIKEKTIGPYEKQYFHKNGQKVDVLIGISLIDEEEGLCGCYVLNISTLKNKERQLESTGDKLKQALDEQIKTRKQIENYLKDLESINKELDDFVYSASHDLKEPLRAIGGLSSLLMHDRKTLMKQEEKDELLKDIVHLSAKSRSQIDSLLSYSTVGTHKMQFTKFSAVDLVQEVLRSFEFQINEAKAEVIIESLDGDIEGDRNLVMKIFENLLSNALKYSKGKPVVKIGSLIHSGVKYYIVEDNGPGIAEKDREFIFQIFKTLHPEKGGTGAGLTIVKKIINSHHGDIKVEASPLGGAKFIFSLGNT